MFLAGAAVLCAMPARAAGQHKPNPWSPPVSDMERVGPGVWVKALLPDVWITCFSFGTPDFGEVHCNGLIVAGDSGAAIVDTGNTREQGALLLETASRVTGKPAAHAVATHFHNDRTGGIEAMRAAGVPVLAHPYSIGLAQAYGAPVPAPLAGLEKGPVALGDLELFWPGPGHTRDNITVWHQASGTLFGGCLLRATNDSGVGSRGDADMEAYPATLARLAKRYPVRRFTIPGHGPIAGDSLAWTQTVVAKAVRTVPPRP